MGHSTENAFTQENTIEACIEALLFVASAPIPVSLLTEVLEKPAEAVEASLAALEFFYKERGGLRIQRFGGRVQLTTAPELAWVIEKYLGLEATARLSRAALEALAIIAYRQPITRPGIDAIRGVNSDGVLRSLLSKGLIEEAGRAEGPGRPIFYVATQEFLQHFGLSSLEDLPPYETDQAEPPEDKPLLKD
ncbi:MAG: SMC-Scp complex subunit ScpB [Anaerolineaceae bacterium]|nr:SMC-Scp complex subunit ScpB [Anaerolineaceae bacterium]